MVAQFKHQIMRKYLLFFIFIISIGFAPLPNQTILAVTEPVLAGTAKVEITPPIGTPLAGYGKRRGKPSKGVFDSLYSRTLSLSHGGQTFIFTSLDLVLIDVNLRKEIIKKVREETKIPVQNIMIFATHTHSGAGALGNRFWERFIAGKFDSQLFDDVTTKIADSILRSLENQVPVAIEYGESDVSDLIENRMDESFVRPVHLKILQFKHERKVIANFVLLPAHPTLYSARNRHFSADFPGVLSNLTETKWPESVMIFANGASGDLRPKAISSDYPERRVTQYGKALFNQVEKMKFQKISLGGEWQSVLEEVKLPRVQVRAGFLKIPSVIGNRFFPRKTFFQIITMENLAVMAYPAEVTSEVGNQLETIARNHGKTSFLIGYANDYMGYVVPERVYRDRSQYESRASFYGSKLDYFFYQNTDRLLKQLALSTRVETGKEGALVHSGQIPVLQLYGTPYEMGFQHGTLMKGEIRQARDQVYRYMAKKLVVPGISRLIVKKILDRSWKKMEPFVSYDEMKELEGLAMGSGLPLKDIKRLHAVPDLVESMCTNGVYFGPATKDGKLIHIRNLDWLKEMGVHHFAVIFVYHPSSGNQFVNIGYYGFTGTLSGVNQQGISVGQVGADSIDETLKGTPMPFLLKRVLWHAKSLDQAVEIITTAHRTSSFNYVFGDAKRKESIAIETTAHHFKVFTDNDPLEAKSGYGLPSEGTLLRADPAFEPSIRELQTCSHGDPKKPGLEPPGGSAYEVRYVKQSQMVKENYGKITPEIARDIAKSIAPDSNIQSVVFRFPDFWVANATDELPAAETEYHHFNFDQLTRDGSQ